MFDGKQAHAIKSNSKKKNNYFFTCYSSIEKAIDVQFNIEKYWKPEDNKVNFIWDSPGKLI